ncbi:hypothetical protein C6Y45_06500 [Alkalicoccus saliphilus]|uniref:Uncharacterized protein n=1 Tax=Alkalicoccus saliphilus TaxID=200989 RepID=A0A2T4U777_9BACI|nr:hypothetical protein C6Y45_06500 [Alkalicoccus saliphilus]
MSYVKVRRFPLRFFQRKRKVLLFMNVVLYSVTPMPRQRRLRKCADPPGRKGQPHAFSAAGIKSCSNLK